MIIKHLRLFIFCAIVTFSFNVNSTVIRKLDLSDLVGRADAVFIGKVINVQSLWTKDKHHIVTDATLIVEKSIHGTQKGQKIVVRRLGGTVNGIGMRTTGVSILNTGDKVLLFTEKHGSYRYVVGMKQGLFRITKDNKGQLFVNRNLEGLEFIQRVTSDQSIENNSPPSQPVLLGTFIKQINHAIAICIKETKHCRAQ